MKSITAKRSFLSTLFGVDMTSEALTWLLSSSICLPPALKAVAESYHTPCRGPLFDKKQDDKSYKEWMEDLTADIETVKALTPTGQEIDAFVHANLIRNFESCWNAAAELLTLAQQDKQTENARKVFDYISVLKQIILIMRSWQF
jgi:hypothetical protein